MQKKHNTIHQFQHTCQHRRQFLKKYIVLTGVISSGSFLASIAPSTSWALEAHHLNSFQAQSLLSMAKRLYPHEGLDEAVYAILVKDIDQLCNTPETRKVVLKGLSLLNSPHPFNELSAAAQVEKLNSIQETDFFHKVRQQCITSIYNHPLAQIYFGYEGESWSKGGYLLNGFNDLIWLDNPPEVASPMPFKEYHLN
ncbi:tat (twin-arginine translocation) pathway signal sequence [Paenalcaligenes sp.]|uniref:tat (twin-arginine translocation) pathway signal sequence n=1 Tax=Paenalcaligenes sp. TaxID=1966342 RepID=UPI0026275126|nr:tat (twin-arginine translocation) pathway signal sequence [Paenalcaligenes sp.]